MLRLPPRRRRFLLRAAALRRAALLRLGVAGAAVVLTGGAVAIGAMDRPEAPRATGTASPTATSSPSPTPTPSPTPDPNLSSVAEAVVEEVAVYDEPRRGEPIHELAHPTESGAPLVFLVTQERDKWLRVLLPVRPNGSEGWVRARDVKVSVHTFRVVVRLGAHTIKVTKGDEVILRTDVGVGTQDTPTPGGIHYIKELLQPPSPDGVYGSYAYGLSGFSNELESFGGGESVIGLHGTNDPSSIGQDVSHGCIRMRNEDIEKLVPVLPLGTPVEIKP